MLQKSLKSDQVSCVIQNLKVRKLLQKSSDSCHQILCNLMHISCVSGVTSYVAVACANWIVYEQYARHRHLHT